jgi:predicted nucleic acid-binding protein
MKPVFADTSFYLALLNPQDRHHGRAVDLARELHHFIVTTDFVLVEVGNALSGTARGRDRFLTLTERLSCEPSVTVVPASREALEAGVHRYRDRRDKTWSLTDCISFVVMQNYNVTEALTADHHFEQSGFTALLK